MGKTIRLRNKIEKALNKINKNPNKAIETLLEKSGVYEYIDGWFDQVDKRLKSLENRISELEKLRRY